MTLTNKEATQVAAAATGFFFLAPWRGIADGPSLEEGIRDTGHQTSLAVSTWTKHAGPLAQEPEGRAVAQAFTQAVVERNINTFGALARPEELPAGWRAMALLPSLGAGTRVRQDVRWIGVRADGIFVSGRYARMGAWTPGEGFASIDALLRGDDAPGTVIDTLVDRFELNSRTLRMEATKTTKALQAHLYKNVGFLQDSMRESLDGEHFAAYETAIRKTGGALGGMMARVEQARSWSLYKGVFEAMDAQALACARSMGQGDARGYNWALGMVGHAPDASGFWLKGLESKPGAFGALRVDPTASVRRQQAARLFPVLLPGVICGFAKEGNAVLAGIDAGEELVPALARAYETSPRAVRAVRGLTWQRTGRLASAKAPKEFLDRLPLDAMPENKKQFAQFRHALAMVRDVCMYQETQEESSAFAFGTSRADGDRTYSLRPNAQKAWDKVANTYDRLAKVGQQYTQGGFGDMMKFMESHVIEPVLRAKEWEETGDIVPKQTSVFPMLKRSVARNVTCAMAQELTVKSGIEAAVLWHRDIVRVNEGIINPETPGRRRHWMPVVGDTTLLDCSVHEVKTESRLYTQGLSQNHCVGGYGRVIEKNAPSNPENCLIFSIEKDGKILSTVDIRVDLDPRAKARINQNYAHSNKEPAPLADKVAGRLRRLVEQAPKERWEAHFDSVQAMQRLEPVVEVVDGVERSVPGELFTAGYDARVPAEREKAFAMMSPYMPKAWRKAGWEAFEARVIATRDAENKVKTAERQTERLER